LRSLVISLLLFTVAFAGCAQSEPDAEAGVLGAPAPGDSFRVPDVRVGDKYRYGFGFKGPTFEATGVTDVTVLERVPVADGLGRIRDSLYVLQGSPDGTFQERYWIDADTLAQFKRERFVNYTEESRFPIEPLRPLPVRHASYGNGSGTEELFKEDPLFEDYSFFGGFATGRVIPAPGGELGIPGYFWLRDQNEVLAVYENLTGPVDQEGVDETWGATRHVSFRLDWRQDPNFETMTWAGSFSTQVPLAVEMVRVIKADIAGQKIDVAFNASLMAFEPGEGEPLVRKQDQRMPERRAVEYAAWDRAPPDGTGTKLMFPLSEALATLERDPTAIQYFQAHAGAYLQVAHLSETNTCGFTPQAAYPGCHWFGWGGRFIAPDDYYMDFAVDKFADASGGAPAFIPYVSRDYPFDALFSGEVPPEAPEQPVVVDKAKTDHPPRSQRSADTLTIGGALAAWKATAWSNHTSLDPNVVVVFITDEGYAYYVSHEDWVFPSQDPELVFFYDEGPLVLERHTSYIDATGLVTESLNFWPQVTQR
jgi:hypothetical protein